MYMSSSLDEVRTFVLNNPQSIITMPKGSPFDRRYRCFTDIETYEAQKYYPLKVYLHNHGVTSFVDRLWKDSQEISCLEQARQFVRDNGGFLVAADWNEGGS